MFQDFLRCEYSEENILFWAACEELKKEKDAKSIASKARDIYEDYISILSSKEVSVVGQRNSVVVLSSGDLSSGRVSQTEVLQGASH